MPIVKRVILTGALACLGVWAPPALLESAAAEPAAGAHPAATAQKIAWRGWDRDLFTEARAKDKLVILDLEAVWCHWCHVMEEQTYRNPEVAKLIAEKFIAVRVDQDSRPDLANRYADYGWPATIIFAPDGTELAKRAGFIEPAEMRTLLEKVVKQRVPEAEEKREEQPVPADQAGSIELLKTRHREGLDLEKGGLKLRHRFLEPDSVEYALTRAQFGLTPDADWVKMTLLANRKLFDAVWGGVYQYSTHSGWDKPHFEKIMRTQANNLRLYGLAFALADSAGQESAPYRNAGAEIVRYLTAFLRAPEGAFYTSQDADVVRGVHSAEYFSLSDVERRSRGIPAIDKSIYARENGWIIRALAIYADATGDSEALALGESAASWIQQHRRGEGGVYRHGEKAEPTGPFLGDTLAMGQAHLALYAATARRSYLTEAVAAAEAITKHFFVAGKAGAFTASPQALSGLSPVRVVEENIEVARFFVLLAAYSGRADFVPFAQSAREFLLEPEQAFQYLVNSGIILADQEVRGEPLHVTVVGKKSDPAALALFEAGRRIFAPAKRLEWWDRAEGAMPNADVQYPELAKAAAFVCTGKRCSLPVFDASKLKKLVATLAAADRQGEAKP